jgi:hypothetical protein
MYLFPYHFSEKFPKTVGNLFTIQRFPPLPPASLPIFLDILAVFNIIGEKSRLEIQRVSVFCLAKGMCNSGESYRTWARAQ